MQNSSTAPKPNPGHNRNHRTANGNLDALATTRLTVGILHGTRHSFQNGISLWRPQTLPSNDAPDRKKECILAGF
jgi:hypothetical protein